MATVFSKSIQDYENKGILLFRMLVLPWIRSFPYAKTIQSPNSGNLANSRSHGCFQDVFKDCHKGIDACDVSVNGIVANDFFHRAGVFGA